MPREIRAARRYRLLDRPPFDVRFPSVDYRVEIIPVIGAPQWRLEAWTAGRKAGPWTLCQAGEKIEWLERDLYQRGFELLHPTAASLIMEKLCQEGRAERIA